MDTTQFDNVTARHFDQLKAYLRSNACTGLDGNEGTAIGHCLNLSYRFEPAAGTLHLSAQSLPKNLQALPSHLRINAARRLLANAMGLGKQALGAAATGYPSHPNRYGVYDYVIPYITNKTGHSFTFKSQAMNEGTLFSNVGSIPKDASQLEIFEADSAKLSGTGVGGSVEYVWADNTTVMTISFYLNTIYTHTFTVGFSTNMLTADVTNTEPDLSGYTYLDPQIIVKAM